jgi:hypothetical protein
MERLDSPLDFRILWEKLRGQLHQVARDEAVACAKSKDEVSVRRHQGGYDMALMVVALMDQMKDEERSAETSAIDESGLQ